MPKPEQIPIKRHMGTEDLNRSIRKLERDTKILKRLYFVRYRYQGMSVEVAAMMVGITKSVGYTWQKRWNDDGFSGLIPRYGGGRPSKLSEIQKRQLIDHLSTKSRWTTFEVKELVLREFDVEYTTKQIRIILKHIWSSCPTLQNYVDSGAR